jgi:transposase
LKKREFPVLIEVQKTLIQNLKIEETLMLHTTDKIIKHKVGLLNLAEELGNVSKACQVMGLSRDTFYRYKSAVEKGGVEALFEKSRRQPNLKTRVDDKTEIAAVNYAIAYPAHGQHRASNELRKEGVFVSGSGVRSIWVRHSLENFKARLKALEAKVAEEGLLLRKHKLLHLKEKSTMTRYAVKLRRPTQVTSVHKILFMSVR